MTPRDEITRHIKAHNVPLGNQTDYLKKLTPTELICEAHPNYRVYFINRFAEEPEIQKDGE